MNDKHIEKVNQNKNLIVFTSCFIGFFMGVEVGGLQYVLLNIAREYGLSNATMGTLVSSQYIAILVCPLVVGKLSDIIGKKIIIVLFSIVFAVGSGAVVVAPSMSIIIIGIFIVGLGFGAVENSVTAALSDVYGSKSGKYINFMQCALSLGAVISPIATSYAMQALGLTWRIVFVVCAISFLLAAFVSFATSFLPSDEKLIEEQTQKSKLKSIFSVIMICLILSVMAYISLENGATFFFNSYFTEVLSAPEYSAIALSLFWLSMAASRLIVSFLYKYQMIIVIVCFGVSGVALLSIPLLQSAIMAMALCFIMGLFFGPIWPFVMSIANDEFPKDTGMVSSLMLAAGGIGGAGTPVIVGAISDKADITIGFVFLSIIAIMGMIAFGICCKKFKQRKKLIMMEDL